MLNSWSFEILCKLSKVELFSLPNHDLCLTAVNEYCGFGVETHSCFTWIKMVPVCVCLLSRKYFKQHVSSKCPTDTFPVFLLIKNPITPTNVFKWLSALRLVDEGWQQGYWNPAMVSFFKPLQHRQAKLIWKPAQFLQRQFPGGSQHPSEKPAIDSSVTLEPIL